jgi:polyisoprenoid-binding protein YceI
MAVHVLKKGLLSGMAHDHHFVPGDWSGTASFDPARPSDVQVEVVVVAGSLRDNQPKLSPEDREKVDRQAAGPEVLDASRYQEIRFTANKFEPSAPAPGPAAHRLQGLLVGTLSLHGQKRPLSVRVVATAQGGGWRVLGAVSFKQSDFGIEPYSGFRGTIAVHDVVKVVYDLAMMPAP